MAKRNQSNQKQYTMVCVVAWHIFVFRCALTTGHCNGFQYIFGNQKKSELYGPKYQTMLFLVTMIRASNNIPDALRELGPFAQFKKREKHPWRSVTCP